MKFSCPNIKKFHIFSQKKVFLIFREIEIFQKSFQEGSFQTLKIKKAALKKFIIFQEIDFSCPKVKKTWYFF